MKATTYFFNSNGLLLSKISKDFRSAESISINTYFYNEKNLLVKETLTAISAYYNRLNEKRYSDTNNISTTIFIYDEYNRVKYEKEYSFQCDFDTCDVTEFFYTGKLLTKKYCTNECSRAPINYNYPIYYEYDANDSLISEKAMEPLDTSEIWYMNTCDYSRWPDTLTYERYYRKNDSLQMDAPVIVKTEYTNSGKPLKKLSLNKPGNYDSFEYEKNGFLKAVTTFENNIPTRKQTYNYNRRGEMTRIKNFRKDKRKKGKLKLYYYETLKYIY